MTTVSNDEISNYDVLLLPLSAPHNDANINRNSDSSPIHYTTHNCNNEDHGKNNVSDDKDSQTSDNNRDESTDFNIHSGQTVDRFEEEPMTHFNFFSDLPTRASQPIHFASENHAGNERFLVTLTLHRQSYLAAFALKDANKCHAICKKIVHTICHECVPRGRFLEFEVESEKKGWTDLGSGDLAAKRVAFALMFPPTIPMDPEFEEDCEASDVNGLKNLHLNGESLNDVDEKIENGLNYVAEVETEENQNGISHMRTNHMHSSIAYAAAQAAAFAEDSDSDETDNVASTLPNISFNNNTKRRGSLSSMESNASTTSSIRSNQSRFHTFSTRRPYPVVSSDASVSSQSTTAKLSKKIAKVNLRDKRFFVSSALSKMVNNVLRHSKDETINQNEKKCNDDDNKAQHEVSRRFDDQNDNRNGMAIDTIEDTDIEETDGKSQTTFSNGKDEKTKLNRRGKMKRLFIRSRSCVEESKLQEDRRAALKVSRNNPLSQSSRTFAEEVKKRRRRSSLLRRSVGEITQSLFYKKTPDGKKQPRLHSITRRRSSLLSKLGSFAMTTKSDVPLSLIKPGTPREGLNQHDVLCYHDKYLGVLSDLDIIGNNFLRLAVQIHLVRYHSNKTGKEEKETIVDDLVQKVTDKGGKFVIQEVWGKGLWFEIGNKVVVQEIVKALIEGLGECNSNLNKSNAENPRGKSLSTRFSLTKSRRKSEEILSSDSLSNSDSDRVEEDDKLGLASLRKNAIENLKHRNVKKVISSNLDSNTIEELQKEILKNVEETSNEVKSLDETITPKKE